VIRYLADTNILGYFARSNNAALQRKMTKAMLKQEIAISVITYAETRYGLALLDANDKRRGAINLLLQAFPVLPWTVSAANEYGDIAAGLHQRGKAIGEMDTQIAAHALAENLILVSHNTKHFERIQRLKLEDWMG
jgi:tRNA(fMet)-specific endonuclease VapC